MKNLRWLILLAVMALVLGAGVATVSAAGETPVGGPYVDNGTHSIAPNSSNWYHFEYAGDNSAVTIRMLDAKDKGLSFQVFTPTEMEKWWSSDPIGASSVQGNDLIWSGKANEAGKWAIAVHNANPAPTTYQLVITGDGVSFAPPAASQPVAPSPAVTSVQNADPMKALALDNSRLVVPAQTALWYRFPYDGTRDQAIVTLKNGAENNLRMQVLTPEQISTWWSATPVGQGTAKDKDLVWNGNGNNAGYWYVKVINDNPYDVGTQLQLQLLQNANYRY